MSERPNRLRVLYDEIERRCESVAESRPPWPCRRGCDHCCRSLSELPRLVREEWRRLEIALDRLDAETRTEVESRLDAVARQADEPGKIGSVVCPFLDLDEGACRVYEHRPAACRTYGYYQSRDGGRFCRLVEEHVAGDGAASPWDGVVWGSQDAVDRRLERERGSTISLRDWWLDRRANPPGVGNPGFG